MLKYILLLIISTSLQAKVLKIYLDSDRSHHIESALSIERGIKVAFDEINYEIQGFKVEFVLKDHKGNSVRSKVHYKEFLNDKEALFVTAGLHSPPLIKYRSYINENKALTIVPWAAGGPVTRHPSKDNWIFRLSVDDNKAGFRIADYAVKTKQCKAPHLILEKTPWGESNFKNMAKALNEINGYKPTVSWYSWGIQETQARILLRNIINSNDDCILFVGNSVEGEKFSKILAEFETPLPFISHWGVAGGDFPEKVSYEVRKKINLSFIQSCFSFVSSEQTELSKKVFARLQKLYPEIQEPKDLKAPTGFIHAYDFGRIMIKAMQQIELTEDMEENRIKLKDILENFSFNIQGLVKKYDNPFSVFTENNPDAHEALGLDDFCMAEYGKNNEIIVFPKK